MAHADINSPDRRIRWRARNAQKDAAHRAIENLVRGLKRRGEPLPTCKVLETDPTHVCTGLVHAMHHDYSKPLDVEWACAGWHISEHWQTEWREQRANGTIRVHVIKHIIIEAD